MINSRKLEDLTPEMQTLVEKFIAECKTSGIDIIITSTYRDNESQDALYAQGRTAPGNKVTNAKGGQSMHNYRVAADFVPIVDGKAAWHLTNLFVKAGKIAEKLGLEWGGSWTSFKDLPHVQMPNLSLKDLQKQFPKGRPPC